MPGSPPMATKPGYHDRRSCFARDEAGPGRDYRVASAPRLWSLGAEHRALGDESGERGRIVFGQRTREAQFARPHLAFGRGRFGAGDCAEASGDSANASTAAKQRIEVMAFPACDRNGRGRMMPSRMH